MALTLPAMPAGIYASRNPIIWQATAAAGWDALSSYEAEIQIEIEPVYRSGVWEEVETFRMTPSGAGSFTLDLSAIFRGQPAPELPTWPAATAPVIASTMCRRVRVSATEIADGLAGSLQTGAVWHLIRGGFSAHVGQYLATWAITQQRFLTHQPARKPTGILQTEWLYWIAPAAGTYRLDATLTYQDGTTATATLAGQVIAAQQYDVIIWPAGHTQLNLAAQAQPVRIWEIWVSTTTGTQVSQRMTFTIETPNSEFLSRYYLFEGSLGAMHTLITRGEMTWGITPQAQEIERILPHDAAATAYQLDSPEPTHTYQYTQYTGYLSPTVADWLRDLMRTARLYRVGGPEANRTGTGSLIPLRPVREEMTIRQDNVFVRGYPFSYLESRIHPGI